ncbi:MAG TPA: prepilin-type N-terminal cleavage/methylation domain-containing protein [Firmicutes bacterium]|nr:prepilin-type N-terminal cleavage/methylation domain-containing protein [Candidatus Fermentithermobacillaceae bacterium]
MKARLSSSRSEQSGFTLVEVAVGLAVGMFVLVSTITFLSRTIGVVRKLNIERDIRDQGMMAVETIEREFRKALEYGGSLDTLTASEVTAIGNGHTISIKKSGTNIELTVDGDTKLFPGCKSFEVEPIFEGTKARVIVIKFVLGDEKHEKSFKAAFSAGG